MSSLLPSSFGIVHSPPPSYGIVRFLGSMAAIGLAGLIPAAAAQTGADWPSVAGDPGGSRYSTLRQNHRGNVR
ncbi:MAG: hypothetical protein KY468_16100, partial [Armatimonadetes bacterium]|nr:hypothetical protein [Armatimonadota bacterium]